MLRLTVQRTGLAGLTRSIRLAGAHRLAGPTGLNRLSGTGLSRLSRLRGKSGLSGESRFYSLKAGSDLGDYEKQIFDTLVTKLDPTSLVVRDVSGGCGSMFAIQITSTKFAGMSMVKQHRLVNEILGSEISKWHGLQLRTSTPKN